MARPEEDDDDLDQWIDTLAGRKTTGDSPAAREAQALREAIARHTARSAPQPPAELTSRAAEDHAWQRLAFRLRREGLTGRESVFRRPWVPAAAAAALVLGIGVNIYLGSSGDGSFAVSYSEAPQFRGGAATVIEVSVSRPVPAAQRLAIAAQRLKAAPLVYAFGGKAVLDMEVPAESLDELRQVFVKEKIPDQALQVGLVRVVFNP